MPIFLQTTSQCIFWNIAFVIVTSALRNFSAFFCGIQGSQLCAYVPQSITNSDVFSSISLAISSADFTKLYQPVLILLSKLFFVLFPPRNTFILSPFFLHWIDHYFSRCGQLVHEEFSKYIITPIRLYIIHFRVNLPMFCGGMSYLPKRFNPLQDHIFMFMPQASSRCSSNAELNLKKKTFPNPEILMVQIKIELQKSKTNEMFRASEI